METIKGEYGMQTQNYQRYKLSELEDLHEQWIIQDESEEDPDFRQEWVVEGIEIHKELVRKEVNDEKKAMYFHTLAELYLEFGRSEKMIQGNDKTAFRYLQRAASYMPNKGDTFYHLAFLAEKITPGNEKWESAAFYAKEALERELDEDKEIKIWCLLGKAYLELGFTQKAEECFGKSKKLDQDDEFTRFRVKYSKKASDKASFLRLDECGARISKRADRDNWIEKSRLGQCFVLEVGRRGTTLYGNGASMALTIPQAELLKLFFEVKSGLTKYDILNNTISPAKEKNANSIKTDIRRLRSAIKKGIEVEEHTLIQTIGDRGNQKYILNPHIEKYLIE